MFCLVCFGDLGSPLVHGYFMGVAFLLVLVLIVLGAFASMFLGMRKRMKNSPQ